MIWLDEKYQQKKTHVSEKAMQEEWCSMQPLVAAAMPSWLAVFNFGLAAKCFGISRDRWSISEVDPSDEGQAGQSQKI